MPTRSVDLIQAGTHMKIYTKVIGFAVAAVLAGFGYCFLVGVVEAGCAPRCIPASVLQIYCGPSHLIEEIPFAGIFFRIGDEFGYRIADGPDTTR